MNQDAAQQPDSGLDVFTNIFGKINVENILPLGNGLAFLALLLAAILIAISMIRGKTDATTSLLIRNFFFVAMFFVVTTIAVDVLRIFVPGPCGRRSCGGENNLGPAPGDGRAAISDRGFLQRRGLDKYLRKPARCDALRRRQEPPHDQRQCGGGSASGKDADHLGTDQGLRELDPAVHVHGRAGHRFHRRIERCEGAWHCLASVGLSLSRF
ncbi:MAG: hypothetical protein ACRED5_18125 [Propylenella sp.]